MDQVQDRIDYLNGRLKAVIASEIADDREYPKFNPERRLRLEIELLEHGCQVEHDNHGLLVNRKFIVAIGKNKWCIKGKYVWYYYKDIPTFVSKYVTKP